MPGPGGGLIGADQCHDCLHVVGMGEEVDRLYTGDVVASGQELGQVSSERVRIAVDVYDTPGLGPPQPADHLVASSHSGWIEENEVRSAA